VSEKGSGKDDALTIAAVLIGVACAYGGRHVVLELVGGVALALGGAIAAVRGPRPLTSRGLLSAGFAAGALGLVCALALELYQEWVASQWLAEGAPVGQEGDELRTLARVLSIVRIAGLAGGLTFLFGALVDRMGGSKKK
jgi:hypothetical protein